MKKVLIYLLIVLLLSGCNNEKMVDKKEKATKVTNINCEFKIPDNFMIRFKSSALNEDYTIYKLNTERKLVIVNNNIFTDNIEYYEEITKNSKTKWVHLIQESDYELGWILDEKMYAENEVESVLETKLGKILTGCSDFKDEIYQYPKEEIFDIKALKYRSLTEDNYQMLLHPTYRLALNYSNSEMDVETLQFYDNITSITELTLPNTYLFDIKL